MHRISLSDEELVSQIASLCLEGRRLVARLIVHLVEVEDRGLDKKSACSSMWAFCTERLKMSEGETSRRLNAAKLVRRFPSVLGRIERGEIHLSALRKLGPYLKEENVDAILEDARGSASRASGERRLSPYVHGIFDPERAAMGSHECGLHNPEPSATGGSGRA